VGQPKWPQMGTVSSTVPPSQPLLVLVSPDLQGMRAMPVVTGMTYLLGVLHVPPYSLAARVAMAVMAAPSMSSFGGAEPTIRKALP
jgi:hypothetical protein